MAVFRFKYKGIPIDASFCTLGTLQVSSRFVNFPKGPATYLNSTADKINTPFGYKESSVPPAIDLSNKFNAYTQEYNATITNTFTASGNLSSSYTNVTTTIPTYTISNIYSKIGVLSEVGVHPSCNQRIKVAEAEEQEE